MKRSSVLAIVGTVCGSCAVLGTNITLPDNYFNDANKSGLFKLGTTTADNAAASDKTRENNEVEPGAALGQVWDAELMELSDDSGHIRLTLQAGFNFTTGVASGSDLYTSGAIFIDVDGIRRYGNHGPEKVDARGTTDTGVNGANVLFQGSSSGNASKVRNEHVDYEYAVVLDTAAKKYTVWNLDENERLIRSKNFSADQFDYSNPYTYDPSLDIGPTGNTTGGKYLSSTKANAVPEYTGLSYSITSYSDIEGIHYRLELPDLDFLTDTTPFFHWTMTCGNDVMVGGGLGVHLPDGGLTVAMLGISFVGLSLARRKVA